MSDGTTEPAQIAGSGFVAGIYFDTQLDRHCLTVPGWKDPAGKARCFPLWGANPIDVPAYTDPACTAAAPKLAYLSPFSLIVGEPLVPNDSTLVLEPGTSTMRYFAIGAQHSGTLYTTQCSPAAACCALTGTYYEYGAEFPLSTAVEVVPARF
jgi:hypothetical protein